MIQIELIRTDKEKVVTGLKKRNWSNENLTLLDEILHLDDRRKSIQSKYDQLLFELKNHSNQVGELMKQNRKEDAAELMQDIEKRKNFKNNLEEEANKIKSEIELKLLTIPNIPAELVPFGSSPEENFVYREYGRPLPELNDNALKHWEIGEKYQLFDLKLGVKLTGSGFVVYRGQGAKLERSLINYFLDYNISAGYEEILPPHLVNAASAKATGQLPDKESQMYFIEKDDLYLIPTSEVPTTNIYRDEILKESELPIKLTSFTPCFRREAGSYGAHVKGLNRVHQFNKVEIVRFEKPENSYLALDIMVNHVAALLETLELPYRILRLCGGDMGFASAMTYDFEVWSIAQKRWLEVSSVSNFESFQSNRLRCRYKDENGQNQLCHTLNGSSLALARIVAAILENNQSEMGIKIPQVLRNYFGSDYIS